MLLVDVSASSFFGTVNQMKNEVITEICAVLAFSAITNNDKVGIIFFSDHIEKFIPPKKGKFHILRIIRELINFEPSGTTTNISEALKYFNNVMKKRTIAFMLSDFMSDNYEDALNIAGKKHDIVGIQVMDPREQEMPNVGLAKVRDAETGQVKWMDTSSKQLRTAYKSRFLENQHLFEDAFLKSGCDKMQIRTDHSYINTLLRFFKRREARR